MNPFLIFIISFIIITYFLEIFVEWLNLKHISPVLPDEFINYYDNDQYKKSQLYLKENTSMSLFHKTFFTILIIFFILIGGFNYVDQLARSFNYGYIITGLIFTGILIGANQILEIPFSIYDTFVIENKYGFNTTTIKTYILDIIKSTILGAVIGGLVYSCILWFFHEFETWAWLYCWIAVTFFQIFILFIGPILILPLFNKFIPLEEGELKLKVENYAKAQNFKIKGLFKMDGSKRSNKSNAYFTGFGKYRRIVLFDTLIEKHTVEELVAVLAHEMGHYKKNHILQNIILSIIISGTVFFMLSLFINNAELFRAFKMQDTSIYASLLFFGFLYEPVSMILSILTNALSRKHENESDEFAVKTYGNPDAMISALKKLSVDNLNNLTPHPLLVTLKYSHPPVLTRIERIRSLAVSTN